MKDSGTEPKPSKLINEKLDRMQKAQGKTEASYDTIVSTIMELTSLMCEMQNNINLTSAHVDELKNDIKSQEKAMETRGKSVDGLIKESNRIMFEWEYEPPEPPAVPPSMSIPPPAFAPKRRFVAVDGFKPKILSIEVNYEDYLDFC